MPLSNCFKKADRFKKYLICELCNYDRSSHKNDRTIEDCDYNRSPHKMIASLFAVLTKCPTYRDCDYDRSSHKIFQD